MAIDPNYYNTLARIESSNNPLARAPTSSASGLYQFTKPTWEGLGYDWSSVFDIDKQQEAIQKFTSSNAGYLSDRGLAVNNASLYAAHFLGAGTAAKVLSANSGDSLADIVGSKVIKANSFLAGMTVGDFGGWLNDKTGGVVEQAKALLGNVDAADVVNAFIDPIGAAMNVIGKTASEATGISKLIDWLKEFFSANTAARFAAVIIGIIFIAVAVIAVVMSTDAGKAVVKGAAAAA